MKLLMKCIVIDSKSSLEPGLWETQNPNGRKRQMGATHHKRQKQLLLVERGGRQTANNNNHGLPWSQMNMS